MAREVGIQGRHQDFNLTKAKIQPVVKIVSYRRLFRSDTAKNLSLFGYVNIKVQEACNIIKF